MRVISFPHFGQSVSEAVVAGSCVAVGFRLNQENHFICSQAFSCDRQRASRILHAAGKIPPKSGRFPAPRAGLGNLSPLASIQSTMMLPGHHIPYQELLDILRSSVPGRVAITSADTGIPATLAFGGQDGCACPEAGSYSFSFLFACFDFVQL